MAGFNMKAVAIAIAVASAGVSSVAVGSLSETMNDMFMTTSTKPQPYNSSTRNGFYGGSVSIRAPVRNYTLMSYSAPRISMGCSGISLSAGSFSMMNSDQFKQMIRQIGSSAGMYFFKMAIDTISPSIMRNLNGLEKLMQDMTLNNVNTCKVGENLAKAALGKPNDIDETMTAIVTDAGRLAGVASNMYNDVVDAFSKKGPELADAAGGPENMKYGNNVWRLLVMAGVGQSFGVGSTTHNPDKVMEYALNMVGTMVTSTDETQPVQGYTAQLTIQDLLEGSNPDAPKFYYACKEITGDPKGMDCTEMELRTFEFEGTRRYVNNVVFGSSNGVSIEPGSLLDNLLRGAKLDNTQLSFLHALPPDFMNNFIRNQKSYAATALLVRSYSEFMALSFAEKIAGSLIRTIDLASDGKMGDRKVRFELSQMQLDALKLRKQEWSSLRGERAQAAFKAGYVLEQANRLAANNPKVFYQPFGRS